MSNGDVYYKAGGIYVLIGNVGGGDAPAGGGGADISSFNQVGTSPWERWYAPALCQKATRPSSLQYTNIAVDTIIAVPFVSPRGGTLDRLGMPGAYSHDPENPQYIRLGIYSATSASNLYPNALVLDSGEISIGSSDATSVEVDVTLEAGVLYWLVQTGDNSGGPSFYCYDFGYYGYSGQILISRILGMTSAFNKIGLYCSVAQAYGALPSTFPEGAAIAASDTSALPTIPFVGMRYSA